MFEGFEQKRIRLADAEINLRMGGDGPPLLLLHGFPQTHAAWHRVAPLLRDHFHLVLPDLRGYGDSRGPEPDADHDGYSKRSMAADMIAVMAELGFDTFNLAGHDRGARVAYRLTLDHPERVRKFASLDVAPTLATWEGMDMQGYLDSYHWPFLAQPAPLPERLIGNDPDFYLDHLLTRWAGRPGQLAEEAVAAYRLAMRNPAVVQAMAEDYRAGADIDMRHDRADRDAGRKITCPLLVIWGNRYLDLSPAPVWRDWAEDIREVELDCGHFIAEEAPEDCARALLGFFSDAG